jgi:hypothetical protein
VQVPSGAYALTELVNGTRRTAVAQGSALRLDTRLLGRDAQVWSIRPR